MWKVQFAKAGRFRCFSFTQKDSAESFFGYISKVTGVSQCIWGSW